MKTLLIHPGTQYSHRLAYQLNRIGYLYKFITGIAFASDSFWLKNTPRFLKARISNRILDKSITANQIEIIPLPELTALYRLFRKHDMETVLHNRNELFQRRIKSKLIERADQVIGFDTSSWILAERAGKLNKPFFLDQSIGHPIEKDSIFSILRQHYPEWKEDIPQKEISLVRQEEEEHQLSTRIIVASMFTKNSLVKNGVPANKIILNPYGIGQEFFRKKGQTRQKGKIRFVYLGTLGARKGLPFLIETWMENELFKKAELWLAGPGSDFAITTVANTPGLTYKGRVSYSQIPDLLTSCDCLIFPSFFEGFGQVILEAMAVGLPVITTEATAGPDIIENEVDGFIIPSGNKEELIKAMRVMIDDPALCFNMGNLAQEKAKLFSWNSYGDRWKAIIQAHGN